MKKNLTLKIFLCFVIFLISVAGAGCEGERTKKILVTPSPSPENFFSSLTPSPEKNFFTLTPSRTPAQGITPERTATHTPTRTITPTITRGAGGFPSPFPLYPSPTRLFSPLVP